MQVPTASPGNPPQRAATVAPVLLLPNVVPLLTPGPESRARRAEAVEQQREEQRRRQQEYHGALSAAAYATRPSDVVIRAERNMLPGSHAAERAQVQEQAREHELQAPRGFRQALADAGARTAFRNDARAPAQTSNPPAPNQAVSTASDSSAPMRLLTAEPPATLTAAGAVRTTTAGPTGPPATNGLRATPAVAPTSPPIVAAGAAGTSATASISAAGRTGTSTSTSAAVGAPAAAAARSGYTATTAPSIQLARAAHRDAAAKQDSAAPQPDGNFEPNIERILRLIQTRIGKDRSVTTLRLDPPELGTLRLHLDLRHDQLTLQVETQTTAARRLLEEKLDTLRRNLEAAGIHLQRIELRVAAATTDRPNPDTSPQQGQPHSGGQHPPNPDHDGPDYPARPEAQPGVAESPTPITGTSFVPAAEPLVNVFA